MVGGTHLRNGSQDHGCPGVSHLGLKVCFRSAGNFRILSWISATVVTNHLGRRVDLEKLEHLWATFILGQYENGLIESHRAENA